MRCLTFFWCTPSGVNRCKARNRHQGAGRDRAPGGAPEARGRSCAEEPDVRAAGGAAKGNGCCLNADERAGVTGLKSGGGCIGRLGLTTDISAARVNPGDAPAMTAITVNTLCISPSASRRRKPATAAARAVNRPEHLPRCSNVEITIDAPYSGHPRTENEQAPPRRFRTPSGRPGPHNRPSPDSRISPAGPSAHNRAAPGRYKSAAVARSAAPGPRSSPATG